MNKEMGNVTFSLSRVSSALTDKPLYRASVPTNRLLGHDELSERLAERTQMDTAFWKYCLDVLTNEIDTQLLEGNRVNLGRFSTCLSIRGTFKSEDEEFDPNKHQLITTVRILDPLKSALASIVPENVTNGLSCTVAAVMDSVTKRLSEISSTNRVLIQGQRLGISPDNPDEGVWLENPKTGEIVATAMVERSDSQTIDCVFAEPPEPGTYTLVVSCRNGARESLRPAVAKTKNVVVVAPSPRPVRK